MDQFLTIQKNPNLSKGEIKKRVDRLWKEVDSETKNLYRVKASQLGHGLDPNTSSTTHSMVPNLSPGVMSPLESMVYPSNMPNNIPPPPLPEDETPIDLTGKDADDGDKDGPKLITLQCPVKNDPSSSVTNDGEPAPKLQAI